MPTIWLVRHGEREDQVDKTWFDRPQRAYDDPLLTAAGRKQVCYTLNFIVF
jgi:broad specificity phosphatase PhoE